jgi:hypothetical protein
MLNCLTVYIYSYCNYIQIAGLSKPRQFPDAPPALQLRTTRQVDAVFTSTTRSVARN